MHIDVRFLRGAAVVVGLVAVLAGAVFVSGVLRDSCSTASATSQPASFRGNDAAQTQTGCAAEECSVEAAGPSELPPAAATNEPTLAPAKADSALTADIRVDDQTPGEVIFVQIEAECHDGEGVAQTN